MALTDLLMAARIFEPNSFTAGKSQSFVNKIILWPMLLNVRLQPLMSKIGKKMTTTKDCNKMEEI